MNVLKRVLIPFASGHARLGLPVEALGIEEKNFADPWYCYSLSFFYGRENLENEGKNEFL